MKLYEFPPTRSIRVRWTLQEMQLNFESILVNLPAREHHAAEFLKINPAAKVPVLVDDDRGEGRMIVIGISGRRWGDLSIPVAIYVHTFQRQPVLSVHLLKDKKGIG